CSTSHPTSPPHLSTLSLHDALPISPSPLTIPLASVVFPVPSSPDNRTRTGGFKRAANSLPHRMVSSAECVMNTSATLLQLPHKSQPRSRKRVCHFARKQT